MTNYIKYFKQFFSALIYVTPGKWPDLEYLETLASIAGRSMTNVPSFRLPRWFHDADTKGRREDGQKMWHLPVPWPSRPWTHPSIFFPPVCPHRWRGCSGCASLMQIFPDQSPHRVCTKTTRSTSPGYVSRPSLWSFPLCLRLYASSSLRRELRFTVTRRITEARQRICRWCSLEFLETTLATPTREY